MKISVVVTAFNHEKYIAQCLDSILMQKGSYDLEVILGDDCSTDNTRQIMQDYQSNYPDKLTLLPLTTNLGITKNIKRCLDKCTGDYIAFCEGDDYWTDAYKLQKQMEFFESHLDYSVCFNAIMIYYEAERRFTAHPDQVSLETDTITVKELIAINYIGNFSCCMYRSKIINQLPEKLFDINTVDWMFNMACGQLGKIGFIRDWMSTYRIHSNGAWSKKSNYEGFYDILTHIDIYDHYFSYQYSEQFSRLKEQIINNMKTSQLKPRLIRAIKHPRQAFKKSLELTFKALHEANTKLFRKREKKIDLIVLDTIFPHPLSAFRFEEFFSYLKYFRNSIVLTTGEHLHFTKEIKNLNTIIHDFEIRYPKFKGRTRITTHFIDNHNARLAYLTFLNNIKVFIRTLEDWKIPFVFTLYPGGGFELNQERSDNELRRVFGSTMFRKVIVTQQITYEYLVKNDFCPKSKIEFIYGGIVPLATINKSKYYKKLSYGLHKDRLDICFVANKYMAKGIDKGYDVFLEVAQKLVKLHNNIFFHVVGNFDESDLPIAGLETKISFYGFQISDWFNRFYSDKDLILSPNIPFTLSAGSFDGFPTGCCVEAGLRKVAIFCTDELKLNTHLLNDKEIVIIPHNSDNIVHIIESFYKDPTTLRDIGERGALKLQRIFSYNNQVKPRINLLVNELRKVKNEEQTK